MIDGTLQSVGWAVNLAVMSNWFPKRGRGLLIGCWASNTNVGDIIGAQIYKAATNTTDLMWGTGIIIVGSLVIVVGILDLLFLIEFPWEKGIVINEDSHILQLKTEEIKQDALPLVNHEDIQPISFFKALMIPGVIVFSLSFFFIKFSMYGFYYWLPSYLQEGLDYSKDASANIFSLFGVGAICGNILMGLSTDVLSMRSPVLLIGIALSSLSTFALTAWGENTQGQSASIALISMVMFILGAALNGSSIIIAAIECDLGTQEILKNNQKALATVSGIVDGIAGFGSILG